MAKPPIGQRTEVTHPLIAIAGAVIVVLFAVLAFSNWPNSSTLRINPIANAPQAEPGEKATNVDGKPKKQQEPQPTTPEASLMAMPWCSVRKAKACRPCRGAGHRSSACSRREEYSRTRERVWYPVQAADKNNDGLITRTEMSDAGQLPPELLKEGFITRAGVHEAVQVAACGSPEVRQARASVPTAGLSMSPETKGAQQPQGPTGPVDTKSGGAPAESSQG